MSSAEKLLRLRLATRTLLEWKTPSRSPQYQRVLCDLLAVHPFAADSGLTLESWVLQLDEQGGLLWYLSDTLETAGSTEPSKLGIDGAFLINVATKGLIEFGVFASDNAEVWRGGPTKLDVTDAIYQTLVSKNEDNKIAAFATIISILVPLDLIFQKKYISKLEKQAEFLMISSHVKVMLDNASIIIFLASIILYAFILLNNVSFLRYISTWIGNLALTIAISIPIIIFYIFIFYKFRKLTIYNKILTKLTYRINRTYRKLVDRIINILSVDWVLKSYENLCSITPDLMASILVADTSEPWKDIALGLTRRASPVVVKNVLQILRNPDIDHINREKIFHWLCKVQATPIQR